MLNLFRYIPGLSNPNLRLKNKMVDSGFYYLFHALKLHQNSAPEDLNPFYYQTRFTSKST